MLQHTLCIFDMLLLHRLKFRPALTACHMLAAIQASCVLLSCILVYHSAALFT